MEGCGFTGQVSVNRCGTVLYCWAWLGVSGGVEIWGNLGLLRVYLGKLEFTYWLVVRKIGKSLK